jgi:hypothetical protein
LFGGYSKGIPLKAKDFSMCDKLLQTLLETAIFECFGPDRLSTELLDDLFWQKLAQSNQDFRKVTKMFDQESIEIELQSDCTGVFSPRDPHTKINMLRENNYDRSRSPSRLILEDTMLFS